MRVRVMPLVIGGWRFHPIDNDWKLVVSKYDLHMRNVAHSDKEACGYGFQENSVRRFMKVHCNAYRRNSPLATEYSNYQSARGHLYNLPEIIDYGEDGSWTFLVMEDLGMNLGNLHRNYGPLQSRMISDLVSGMVRLPSGLLFCIST